MEKITITTTNDQYDVLIDSGLRHHLDNICEPLLRGKKKALIISDTNVYPLYGEEVKESLEKVLPVASVTVPSGEKAKSLSVYSDLLTTCIEEELDRNSIIIALGGGVVGDIAGFTAATYMRGIPFIQVPTTLLAQDSSVGGKTGINHPLGKNLIGAFHQPSAVVYDIDMLQSLPDKEWLSGFAEMMKHAYIQDKDYLVWLKENVKSLEDIKKPSIQSSIRRSIAIKAKIVEQDEKEAGIRAFLNFGHTLGHALENVSGYGEFTHGEAVACGMLFAMRLSNMLGISTWDISREKEWFEAIGYPVDMATRYEPEQLVEAMRLDKKRTSKDLAFVLLKEAGKPVKQTVEERVVLQLLKEMEG